MDLDYAVIGGGVAGAYTAWRLQQDRGADASIGLFEYGDRIGGRLYSVTVPGVPSLKAELGGMRYIPDSHKMVADLVDHLKLPTRNFPMGAPDPVGANCNLFYLRGRHMRLHELSDPAKVPYNMAWSERGLGPTNLQVQVMNNIYPGFADLSLCDQMKIKVFGQPMWKYGFWDLMFRVLSNEGYQFMKDAGGYDANVANANAVTQLPATEYGDETQYLTLCDGYQALPLTLAKRFNALPGGNLAAGSRIFMNHCLKEIRIGDGKYRYELVFQPTVTENAATRMGAADPIVVRAKSLVLALPRRSLELVKSDMFEAEPLKSSLGSVLIQSAFKLFMAYQQPWWRSLGLVAGRSVTDLPVRQIFYFGTEGEQSGGDPTMNSLLMASYNDISTVPFWKGLEIGEPYIGPNNPCIAESPDEAVPITPYRATRLMVEVANAQIATVHALPSIPMPYAAVYHTWNEDPYGGGWHEWKAGYRLDKIMWQMLKPLPDQDVHIVGEAYSYGQGWVEGSLTTAEQMLQTHMGLTPPRWLDPNYQLMPAPEGGCGEIEGCLRSFDTADVLQAATPSCFGRKQIS
ncbi:FAD-dependent oxidoreductase [Sphingosinicella sp. BN140058]|uniref:flavin monoamine oxidase family protein n=1 Tax=Sphingosinicella sp. BN140058 TaxID=1892855 RepID=UPI0010137A3C|nr:FAD-dependent oxidoreductase [Sphingosinicella sp. BN140058]QAY77446.1 amine oxidoreductase [Sphingosinicella sp. BN140058]